MHSRITRLVLSVSLCAAAPYLAAAQQLPTISATAANGANVVIVGKNLGGTTEVTVGEEAVTSLAVNADGTTVTGTLSVVPARGSYVLTLRAVASPGDPPATCAPPQPMADWVCIGTGWVPPNHPLAQ